MTMLIALLRRCLTANTFPDPRDRTPTPFRAAGPGHVLRRTERPAQRSAGTRRVSRLYVIRNAAADRKSGALDARIILSGGIDAVCAELDRLAALETRRS